MIIIFESLIDTLFGIALFSAALLLIPQIIKILKTKNTKDFSIISYIGFNIFQLGMALHGYFAHDLILLIGSCACFALNLITIILIFKYRKDLVSRQ